MDNFLPQWVDRIFRRNTWLMWTSVTVLALVAGWVLIGAGHDIIAYEGF